MSKRMSRREMRAAGLLKPKPAPELPEDSEIRPHSEGDHVRPEERDTREPEGGVPPLEAPSAPSPASAPEPAAAEPATTDEAQPDQPVEETAAWPAPERETEGAEQPDEAEPIREPDKLDEIAEDRDGVWANVNAGGAGVTLDAPAEEAPSAKAPSAPSAEGEEFERPSVFDRFAPAEEDAEKEGGESDEDLAASLRQRLRDEPPVEEGGYATEQIEVTKQRSGRQSASIVKTVLQFLVLIIVGFGLGILLGTFLWGGNNSQPLIDIADTVFPLLT